MKKILLVAILALVAMASANAQVAPGMKYKELKGLYNSKEYVPDSADPYSRGWAGVASFIIPGLGQVLDGEAGRGLLFFGGNVALNLLTVSQLYRFNDAVITDGNGQVTGYNDEAAAKSSARIFVGSLLASFALEIWATVDAVKVAKVKNMYYQDLRGNRSSLDFDFAPFFSFTPTEMAASGSSMVPTAGMSLRVSF